MQSLTSVDGRSDSRILICNLHWYYTFGTGITLLALVLLIKCTALSQSESSNFFMYVISLRTNLRFENMYMYYCCDNCNLLICLFWIYCVLRQPHYFPVNTCCLLHKKSFSRVGGKQLYHYLLCSSNYVLTVILKRLASPQLPLIRDIKVLFEICVLIQYESPRSASCYKTQIISTVIFVCSMYIISLKTLKYSL